MKRLLLVALFPILSFSQTQIGSDVNGEATGDQSGKSVSLSADGKVVAIGAPYNDANGTNSGHVRVYRNISGTWTQVGADIDGKAGVFNAYGYSGYSVSLSSDGGVVAIGDTRYSGGGHVRVYRNISGNWTQVGSDITGKEFGDISGRSVSLSSDGSVVAIGGYDGSWYGYVRVYRNISGNWAQLGADIKIEDWNPGNFVIDTFGSSVALSSDGSIVAIGAPGRNTKGQTSDNLVRVYRNISSTWMKVGTDIKGETSEDFCGQSVSLSSDGSVVAIGAPENDANGYGSGHVRVYRNISDTWMQVGADIDGKFSHDHSGYSVSLSSDGSVVAIGGGNSYLEPHDGHIRIYRNIAGNWTQVGANINGGIAGANSWYSVSLSSDGSIVAIGAPYSDENGTDSGHVKMYDLTAVLASNSFVEANFMVYPNPSTGKVIIQLNEGLQIEKVNVYNTLGQLVKTEKNTVISVNSLAKGSYFLEVVTDQGKATKTIIVE